MKITNYVYIYVYLYKITFYAFVTGLFVKIETYCFFLETLGGFIVLLVGNVEEVGLLGESL